MKNVEKHLVGWLSVCLLLCSFPVWAQGDAGDYLTIVGMVDDKIYNFIIHWFTATYSVF